jgi:hypothetical protein
MPTLIISVNNDQDISMGRYIPWDLSMSKCKLKFVDEQTGETVEVLYWDCENGCSVRPDTVMMF